MKQPLRQRVNRSLLLLALGVSAVCSTLLATVSGALVLKVTLDEAQQQASAVERDLASSLTSFQPVYELQRQLQLASSSRELRSAMVIDAQGRVIAASDSALVGRPVSDLMKESEMGDLPRHLQDCLNRQHGKACLNGDPLTLFDGPLPFIGGDHLIRFMPTPLALEGLPAFGQQGTLVIEVDLQGLVARAGQMTLGVFVFGLLPLFLTAGGLVVVVRRQLLPELLNLAQTDSLSGVFNRRAFLEAAAQRLDLDQRSDQPCVVALIDIDHFKTINDQLGHSAGDQVLCMVAEFLSSSVRRSDLVGRLGGDEFALLVEAPPEQAFQLLERLRSRVASQQWHLANSGDHVAVTLSIGMVSAGSADRHTLDSLLQAADAALYVAKDQGRNKVIDLQRDQPKGWSVQIA